MRKGWDDKHAVHSGISGVIGTHQGEELCARSPDGVSGQVTARWSVMQELIGSAGCHIMVSGAFEVIHGRRRYGRQCPGMRAG